MLRFLIHLCFLSKLKCLHPLQWSTGRTLVNLSLRNLKMKFTLQGHCWWSFSVDEVGYFTKEGTFLVKDYRKTILRIRVREGKKLHIGMALKHQLIGRHIKVFHIAPLIKCKTYFLPRLLPKAVCQWCSCQPDEHATKSKRRCGFILVFCGGQMRMSAQVTNVDGFFLS